MIVLVPRLVKGGGGETVQQYGSGVTVKVTYCWSANGGDRKKIGSAAVIPFHFQGSGR